MDHCLKWGKSLGKNRKIHRVGLISPCSGNLGNAAILSSMIANLRSRIPDVEIVGITLSPDDTHRRHGIESFPITGITHGRYHLVPSPVSPDQLTKADRPFLGIKEKLKRIGWLRGLVRTARTARSELAHIYRSGRLVRSLDRVIVTGGGALDDFWGGPWGHPWTLFKFAALSRIFRVPFLFVSVGKCSLDHRLSRRFVVCALRFAQYRSYRDHESQAEVEATFPGLGGAVWPDLAYGYCCPDQPLQRRQTSHDEPKVIAVSPIAFCDPRMWPVNDIRRYSRYINQLAKFLMRAIGDEQRLILFATDGPDSDTINDLMGILAAESVDTSRVEILPGPPEQTTEMLLRNISDADVVIASRLHAVILSHVIAIPVVAISYDRKVDVHMSEIGQSEYCMNIDEFTAETLAERLAVLRDARELESARLRRAVRHYREQADAQFDLLFGLRHSDSGMDQNADRLMTQAQR
ncbi:MAG: polysaccharide pyruvyl transferase family protein [Terracidiphilus sp.]